MSQITAEVVALLARVWHGIDLEDDEAAGIANFLAPIDAVAERAAERLAFEAEPADFQRLIEKLAEEAAGER
jgi:hypothetical protein